MFRVIDEDHKCICRNEAGEIVENDDDGPNRSTRTRENNTLALTGVTIARTHLRNERQAGVY